MESPNQPLGKRQNPAGCPSFCFFEPHQRRSLAGVFKHRNTTSHVHLVWVEGQNRYRYVFLLNKPVLGLKRTTKGTPEPMRSFPIFRKSKWRRFFAAVSANPHDSLVFVGFRFRTCWLPSFLLVSRACFPVKASLSRANGGFLFGSPWFPWQLKGIHMGVSPKKKNVLFISQKEQLPGPSNYPFKCNMAP